MGRNSTECTTAKATSVQVDREFYHLISGYLLVFVFWMRQTGVGQVKRIINFSFRHGWVGRIHNKRFVVHILHYACRMHPVRLFFHHAKVGGMF